MLKRQRGEGKRERGGGRAATVRLDRIRVVRFFVCFPFSFMFFLLLRRLNRQPWQKEQMVVAIRDPRQHLPAWGPTVAPGETTWMTQGGIQAYGTSARSAPELETPPLLHYILSLTQEGQLHAPSIFSVWLKYLIRRLHIWESADVLVLSLVLVLGFSCPVVFSACIFYLFSATSLNQLSNKSI